MQRIWPEREIHWLRPCCCLGMGNLFPFIICTIICILYADAILGMYAKGGKWGLNEIEAACRLAADHLALLRLVSQWSLGCKFRWISAVIPAEPGINRFLYRNLITVELRLRRRSKNVRIGASTKVRVVTSQKWDSYTVIFTGTTGITAVISKNYWLRCFGDCNQKQNL